ncbi:MAG: zinc-dependent alcohol dehydrogenase [Anaerolineae bacterium]
MDMMTAVRCTAPGQVEYRQVPVPEPGPDEVLIETRAVGLCTSDIYILQGKTPMTLPTDHIGHEPAGVVRAVGRDVKRFRPGDRVTSLHCKGGFMQFADYFLQEETSVFPLPDGIPFAYGLCEPLGAVARGICGAGILPGDTVAVVGAGYFGQLLAQAVQFLGAWRTVVLDLVPSRLDVARELGAHAVYNVTEDGVRRAVAEITGGKGFDVVAECAGVQGAFDTCVDLVRVGGTVYSYGWHVQPETIQPYNWHTKHFTLLSNAWVATQPFDRERFKRMAETAIRWLERGFWRVDPLVREITAREDLMAAVERVTHHPDQHIKMVIGPKGGPVA